MFTTLIFFIAAKYKYDPGFLIFLMPGVDIAFIGTVYSLITGAPVNL